MKKGIILSVLNLFMTITVFGQLLGGTYSIGKGGGMDYSSFSAVKTDLETKGANQNVTFKIESDTYTEQLDLSTTISKGNNDTIFFEAKSGVTGDVIIEHTATNTTDNFIVSVLGNKKVVFRNIHFKALSGSFCRIVELSEGAESVRFENCIFEGQPYVGQANSNSDGSLVHSYSNSSSTEKSLHFIGCEFQNGSRQIMISGESTSNTNFGLQVQDCKFKNPNERAIYAENIESFNMVNNQFLDGAASSVGVWILSEGTGNFTNNFFDWKGANGLIVANHNIGGAANPLTIYNNRIKMESGQAAYINNSEDVWFIHNTLYTDNSNGGAFRFDASKDSKVENNLILNLKNKSFEYNSAGSSNNTFEGNGFFNATLGVNNWIVYVDGTGQTLTQWKAVTGASTKTVFNTPKFKNLGQLKISCGHPVVFKTDQSPSVTTDFEGNNRNDPTWMGADVYEFEAGDSVPMSGIVGPNGDPAPGGTVYALMDVSGSRELLDTVGMTTIANDGTFDFGNVRHGDYYFLIDPTSFNDPQKTDYIKSYHDDAYRWENATKVTGVDQCLGKTNLELSPRKLAALSSGGNSVSGQVVLEVTGKSTNPIPGLDVVLDKIPPAEGETVAKTITDANGNYSFTGLPNDTFVVLIDYPGIGMTKVHMVDFTKEGNKSYTGLDYCVDTTDVIDACADINGVEDPFGENFSVYPNPSTGLVLLKNNTGQVLNSMVYNLEGQKVKGLQLVNELTALDLSGYAKGVYWVRVTNSESASSVYKVVIR